jgi:hypothetical protein
MYVLFYSHCYTITIVLSIYTRGTPVTYTLPGGTWSIRGWEPLLCRLSVLRECKVPIMRKGGSEWNRHSVTELIGQQFSRLRDTCGVLTAVTMEIGIFEDVTPCSVVDICRRFGGTCYILRIAEGRGSRLTEMFVNVYLTTRRHIAWDYLVPIQISHGLST